MIDLEDDLLTELYFMTPFEELAQNLNWNADLQNCLIDLLKREWINQYRFDDFSGDFLKTQPIDFNNLHPYSYLASKKGLLAHSGF